MSHLYVAFTLVGWVSSSSNRRQMSKGTGFTGWLFLQSPRCWKADLQLGNTHRAFSSVLGENRTAKFLLRTVSETAATKTPLHSFCAFLLNQVSLHQAPGSIKELHQGRPSEVSTFGMVFIRSLHLSGHWVNQQPSPCALTQSLALPDMCGLQSRMVMFFGNSYLRISGT